MPRYFFDLEVMGLHEYGSQSEEFADLLSAIVAANTSAVGLVAEDIARGDGVGSGSVKLRNEAGETVYKISFVEAEGLLRAAQGDAH